MDRDDNMQQKQEQEEHEQWWENNRRLLNGFEELRPVIEGKRATPIASRFDATTTEKGN